MQTLQKDNKEYGFTSIVIPVYNGFEMTKECIQSIEAFTPEEHEIIFIDNGSTDGTGDFLKRNMKPHWVLIENGKNEGFTRACNQGMEMARGDNIILLNNDVIVSQFWLGDLLECLYHADDIGIVGPRSNAVSGAQLVTDGKYDSQLSYLAFARGFRTAFRHMYLPRYRIVGFCFLFKRTLMEKIGMLDERFSPGNFEDDDYCLRAMEAGYRNVICGDVFIHHHGSKSHDMSKFQQLLDTNKKKFDEKWKERIPKKISAVMIVRDEEEHIAKCLASIYDIVDEIVLVDTGSTDQTPEIAASFGDKVKIYDYEWCDDFGEARNFANSKATGDWLLSIDGDEVFTGLEDIREKLDSPFKAIRINTRNYTDRVTSTGWIANKGDYPDKEACTGWFPSEKVRFWRNHPNVKFEFPVHEVVENSIYFQGYQIITDYSIQVHHYGRMKDDYEYGHGNRYYELLKKQYQSGRDNTRSLEQLATQAQGLQKWDEAINFWQELRKIEPDNKGAFLNIGHCYASKQEWEEAMKWSQKALDADPESKYAAMNVAICNWMCSLRGTGGDENLAEKICEDLQRKDPLYPLPEGLLGAIRKTRSNQIYSGGV